MMIISPCLFANEGCGETNAIIIASTIAVAYIAPGIVTLV